MTPELTVMAAGTALAIAGAFLLVRRWRKAQRIRAEREDVRRAFAEEHPWIRLYVEADEALRRTEETPPAPTPSRPKRHRPIYLSAAAGVVTVALLGTVFASEPRSTPGPKQPDIEQPANPTTTPPRPVQTDSAEPVRSAAQNRSRPAPSSTVVPPAPASSASAVNDAATSPEVDDNMAAAPDEQATESTTPPSSTTPSSKAPAPNDPEGAPDESEDELLPPHGRPPVGVGPQNGQVQDDEVDTSGTEVGLRVQLLGIEIAVQL